MLLQTHVGFLLLASMLLLFFFIFNLLSKISLLYPAEVDQTLQSLNDMLVPCEASNQLNEQT